MEDIISLIIYFDFQKLKILPNIVTTSLIKHDKMTELKMPFGV